MNTFMISCKHATALIEKKHSDALSISEKIQLRFHTLMCNACKQYERHSFFIEKLLYHHAHRLDHSPAVMNAEKRTIEKVLKILS